MAANKESGTYRDSAGLDDMGLRGRRSCGTAGIKRGSD